ncbi:MAG: phosphatidate cytidylyltransferase, partial [Chitinophagaceae bacterium]
MAFNWPIFRTRALTAIVFVAIMLTGLLGSAWAFFALFTIIHFGCWEEYQKMVTAIDPGYAEITPFHRYGVMLAGWSLMLFASGEMLPLGAISFSSIGFWAGIIFLFVLPFTEML